MMAMGKNPLDLPADAFDSIARRFAALAEPMRLRLIQALFDGELSVNALAERTGGTPANISRHLQHLAQAGMLTRRKVGVQVFYAIRDDSLLSLCELACGSLEKQAAKQAQAFRR